MRGRIKNQQNKPLVQSTITVTNGNTMANPDNRIRRFTTVAEEVGDAISYNDSTANGAVFTINQRGLYFANYVDRPTTDADTFGISIDSTANNITIDSTAILTPSTRLTFTFASTNEYQTVSYIFWAEPGQTIRPHVGTGPFATVDGVAFNITRVL